MDSRVIASGNLAAPRRTVMAVLGQMEFMDLSRDRAIAILNDAGLPARALDEPDFPISLEQDFTIFLSILRELGPGQSPIALVFAIAHEIGINHFGVLGLTMQHAATMVEALQLPLAFPQLSWGHSRVVMQIMPEASVVSFAMERPQTKRVDETEIDRLTQYCIVLDLVSTARMIDDVLGGEFPPKLIRLPFRKPADWQDNPLFSPCPIEFEAQDASLIYPPGIEAAQPVYARILAYRSYYAITEKLSRMLADEISLSEQVTRWLWAYSPPLKRGEIAKQLAVSERSLARKLKGENTSYNALFAQVQAERAKNFLRNRTLSVSEIAYRLGYAEPAAFSRAFTSWTGNSPSHWRASILAATPGYPRVG